MRLRSLQHHLIIGPRLMHIRHYAAMLGIPFYRELVAECFADQGAACQRFCNIISSRLGNDVAQHMPVHIFLDERPSVVLQVHNAALGNNHGEAFWCQQWCFPVQCATRSVQFPSIKRTPHSLGKPSRNAICGLFHDNTRRSDYLNIGRSLLARIN